MVAIQKEELSQAMGAITMATIAIVIVMETKNQEKEAEARVAAEAEVQGIEEAKVEVGVGAEAETRITGLELAAEIEVIVEAEAGAEAEIEIETGMEAAEAEMEHTESGVGRVQVVHEIMDVITINLQIQRGLALKEFHPSHRHLLVMAVVVCDQHKVLVDILKEMHSFNNHRNMVLQGVG